VWGPRWKKWDEEMEKYSLKAIGVEPDASALELSHLLHQQFPTKPKVSRTKGQRKLETGHLKGVTTCSGGAQHTRDQSKEK
jgi:hypothetical protein